MWTPEKIATLTTQEVRNLLENAIRLGREEIKANCEAEIESRQKNPASRISNRKERASSPAKRLESNISQQLTDIANKLSLKYDFSKEKARELSIGTKGFIPHKLLDSKNKAKTGGAQKAGQVIFDRYISYRLKDQMFSLLAILINGEEENDVRYQIFGPQEVLSNFKLLTELRPYMREGDSIGKTKGGEEYLNFEEAAERYCWLIDQVAPKI